MSDHKASAAQFHFRFQPVPSGLPMMDRRRDRRAASHDTAPDDADDDQPKLFEVLYRLAD